MSSSEPARVRRATTEDVPALVALMGEFYADGGHPLPAARAARTFERLLASPQLGAVWLVAPGGTPAGFVVLTVAFSMEYGGLRGFVDDLFVAAPYRRQGLASEALEAVENDTAVRVYRRAGFVENGRLLLTMPLATPVHEADGHD